jgi:Holliday junction resolvase RusA-like endonuclease
VAQHFCTLEVAGRPAPFATAHEAAWKEAVRVAVRQAGVSPRPDACFSVRVEFRTPAPRNRNEPWDLDNLVKPTLDAMEGIFGLRVWNGRPQPNDDKVTHLDASKRTVRTNEAEGARVEVWLVRDQAPKRPQPRRAGGALPGN